MMENNKPKVTVVTVTYNCAGIVEETIKSVIGQDYDNLEYIIIDGASSDGTWDIVNRYADRITYMVSEPDKGIYDAMNKGIDAATGRWINFMNAGDVFASNTVLSEVFAEPIGDDVGFVFGKYNALTVKGFVKLENITPFYESKKKLKAMGVNHQAIFTRVDLAKKYPFDFHKFKLIADYNMIWTIYNSGYKGCYRDVAVATVESRDGASASNRRLQRRENARLLGLDGTLWFFYYTNYQTFKSWARTIVYKYILRRKC